LLNSAFNIKVRGIGVASDWIRTEFDFKYQTSAFKFIPNASRSYGLLPAGIANESETHVFLKSILDLSKGPIAFVDVGASIGEFAITMADDQRVEKVYAFEPHPKTFQALSASARRLGHKIELFETAVGEINGELDFSASETSPTGAGLSIDHSAPHVRVPVCKIDDKLKSIADLPTIILMDIEGGELSAMRGGVGFIAARQPLIIFEYNLTSKKSFSLDQIRPLLAGYKFFRLQSRTGKLDSNLDDTWNIVAIPSNGTWSNLQECRNLFA
jgi:FkbM family methyltransferase